MSSFEFVVLHKDIAKNTLTQFELDVLQGLSKEPKEISSKYFYDDAGSLLYAKITELEEYYPIACEREILIEQSKNIVRNHLLATHTSGQRGQNCSMNGKSSKNDQNEAQNEHHRYIGQNATSGDGIVTAQNSRNGPGRSSGNDVDGLNGVDECLCHVQYHQHNHNQQVIWNLIELGAGDGRKSKILIDALREENIDFEYFAIDISKMAVELLMNRMKREYQDKHNFKCTGVVADNMEALTWITTHRPNRRNLVMFLGSSIGNYENNEACRFLMEINMKLQPRDLLLVGMDLVKDPETMVLAYSDPQGVTRDFNLNLLLRMNRDLYADFDPSLFYHMAQFDPYRMAMVSFLIAKKAHNVRIGILGQEFHFDEFEAIRMEYSHKYTESSVKEIAHRAGYKFENSYYDGKKWFVDTVWSVKDR